jgi:hypothetical protein
VANLSVLICVSHALFPPRLLWFQMFFRGGSSSSDLRNFFVGFLLEVVPEEHPELEFGYPSPLLVIGVLRVGLQFRTKHLVWGHDPLGTSL